METTAGQPMLPKRRCPDGEGLGLVLCQRKASPGPGAEAVCSPNLL